MKTYLSIWRAWLLVLAGFLLLAGTAFAAKPDYSLGAGDSVRITVYDHPDLTTEARVSDGGRITFPLIGQLSLDGLTTGQAEARIAELLKSGGYVLKPQVNVLISSYRSQQISVLGQVNRPGRYPIEGASKLSDFLALAGGITPNGADNLILVRIRDGKTTRTEINQLNLFQFASGEKDRVLENDDVLFVPRAPQFYIYGEVQRPGQFRLEDRMTVMQGLSVGGGLTARGTERGIRISRRDPQSGKLKTEPASLSDMLQPDDVIYISESWF